MLPTAPLDRPLNRLGGLAIWCLGPPKTQVREDELAGQGVEAYPALGYLLDVLGAERREDKAIGYDPPKAQVCVDELARQGIEAYPTLGHLLDVLRAQRR